MIEGNLILKTHSDPFIEVYEEYFIINKKKFYYSEVSKVLFLAGHEPLWFKFLFKSLIAFMVFTSGIYPDATSGINEFNVYLKNSKGNVGKNHIFKLKDKHNEMNSVVEIINSKC